jgi:integrase
MAVFKHTVKFVLQQTANTTKETPLRCWVRYNNNRAIFQSGETIEPRYWNASGQSPRQIAGYSNGPKVDKNLKYIKACIATSFEYLTDLHKEYPDPETLKNLTIEVIKNDGILPGLEKRTTDLFIYIEQLIKDTQTGKRVKQKGVKYSPGTVRHYNSAYGVLKRFAEYKGIKSLKFNDITLEFYFEFKDFAYQVEKLSDNYFGTCVKFLKTCMNESKEEQLHANDQYNSKRFVKVAVDVENVYLTNDQLDVLFNHDFSKRPYLERARDLFLVGCWTGLRFSDFTNIKAKNIADGFIEIKTQKTGETVAIPIHNTVKSIMARYEGKTQNSLPPTISNVKLNKYIKEVAEEVGFTQLANIDKSKAGAHYTLVKPLYELISTHTARRAFASNAFKSGVPTIVIMAITGHRSEKAFMKYIKVTPREKAEIMREIWSRQIMKAV